MTINDRVGVDRFARILNHIIKLILMEFYFFDKNGFNFTRSFTTQIIRNA